MLTLVSMDEALLVKSWDRDVITSDRLSETEDGDDGVYAAVL